MLKDRQVTLKDLASRIANIETYLIKLVDALEQITSVKSLKQEIEEIKTDVLKLADERNIFNKK